MAHRPLPSTPPTPSPIPDVPSLYAVLGLTSVDASAEEVRRAFRSKALETHPDKLGKKCSELERADAVMRFRKVYEAFEILSDPQKRQAYDYRYKSFRNRQRSSASFSTLSEESVRRMRDREAWSQKQKAAHEERLSAIRLAKRAQSTSSLSSTMGEAEQGQAGAEEEEPDEEYQEMLKQIMDELDSITPEWSRRRRELEEKRKLNSDTARIRTTKSFPTSPYQEAVRS